MDEDSIAKRIKRARKALPGKVSQDELAKRIGVATMTVSRWETGGLKPEKENLQRLADALGVAPRWIDYGDEEPSPSPAAESRVERDDTQLAPLGALEELEQVMEFLKVAPAYRQRIRDVRWQGGMPLSRGLLTQMVGELVAGYRGETEREAGFARPKGGPQGQEITFPDEDT